MAVAAYPTRNRTIAWKLHSTAADPVPTVGANAVLTQDAASPRDLRNYTTNESSSSLDMRPPIPSGGSRGHTARVNLHGSGTPATPPECDPGLQASMLLRTTLATDVTGTAQSVTGATQVVIAGSDAMATDGYKGMVMEVNGQHRVIRSNNSGTKVVTVTPGFNPAPTGTPTYTILAGVRYKPTSANVPQLAVYDWQHRTDGGQSKLRKLLLAAGSVSLALDGTDGCYWSFTFTGEMQADTDVSHPGTATLQTTRPIPFMAGNVALGGTRLPIRGFRHDLGGNITQIQDPNSVFGMGEAGAVTRTQSGTFSVPLMLESQRDVFGEWAAGTPTWYSAIWGTVPGNRFAVLVDKIVYTGAADVDVDGRAYVDSPYGINGDDDGLHVFYY
jgi:hypothetical protein